MSKVYKMIVIRRRIDGGMPFDKVFEDWDGYRINTHATGYEVCWENPNEPGNWWNEYEDPQTGSLYYGR